MNRREEPIADAVIVFMTVFTLGAIVWAAPVPPNVPPGVPDLRGRCTWGAVIQSGERLTIAGGTQWSAEGTVTEKGVKLRWKCGERLAEGVYKVEGRALVGTWAWVDSPEVRMNEAIQIRDDDGPEF